MWKKTTFEIVLTEIKWQNSMRNRLQVTLEFLSLGYFCYNRQLKWKLQLSIEGMTERRKPFCEKDFVSYNLEPPLKKKNIKTLRLKKFLRDCHEIFLRNKWLKIIKSLIWYVRHKEIMSSTISFHRETGDKIQNDLVIGKLLNFIFKIKIVFNVYTTWWFDMHMHSKWLLPSS